MILIDRIEGIVRIILIDGVRGIAGVVAIHGIEGVVRIVLVDRIERIISLVLIDGVEDVVIALVPFIEAHDRPSRRGSQQNNHDNQRTRSHGRLS